ncbi:uncharacterized protein LOC114322107 [Camellia sinensis]|uniref:uncharacterized protein LOC114322107 n=1 Tax=Camellia sinensis TaxID=4442 RepID=UPI0010366560|nr:uncharacterized protein LOC114322107 [Camellia sinensis]
MGYNPHSHGDAPPTHPTMITIPIWYDIKLAFVAWLVLPQFRGAAVIYERFVREKLRKYGAIDPHHKSPNGPQGSPTPNRPQFQPWPLTVLITSLLQRCCLSSCTTNHHRRDSPSLVHRHHRRQPFHLTIIFFSISLKDSSTGCVYPASASSTSTSTSPVSHTPSSCHPRLFVADLALGASLCLQGLWVLQTGLSLSVAAFIPEGCHKLLDVVRGVDGSTKCDLDDSKLRAVAILDLMFVLHNGQQPPCLLSG